VRCRWILRWGGTAEGTDAGERGQHYRDAEGIWNGIIEKETWLGGGSHAVEAFDLAMCRLGHSQLDLECGRHDQAFQVILSTPSPSSVPLTLSGLSMRLQVGPFSIRARLSAQIMMEAARGLRPIACASSSRNDGDAPLLRATLAEVLTCIGAICLEDCTSRSLSGRTLLTRKTTHELGIAALSNLQEALENLEHLLPSAFDEEASGSPPAAGLSAAESPNRAQPGVGRRNEKEMLSDLELADFAADVLASKADAHLALGNSKAALADCLRALRIRRRIFGAESVHVALCQEKLGAIYSVLASDGLRALASSGARVRVQNLGHPPHPLHMVKYNGREGSIVDVVGR